MSIDEAIKHCEEVAENQEECACRIDEIGADSNSIRECASEHRQLAEWLKELKAYKEAEEEIDRKRKSGQWSEAVVFGMSRALLIMRRHIKGGVNFADSD